MNFTTKVTKVHEGIKRKKSIYLDNITFYIK
jgi:hypothetical protein